MPGAGPYETDAYAAYKRRLRNKRAVGKIGAVNWRGGRGFGSADGAEQTGFTGLRG